MRHRTLYHDPEVVRPSRVSLAGRMRGIIVVAAAGLSMARLEVGASRLLDRVGVLLIIAFAFVLLGSLFERGETASMSDDSP